MVRGASLILLLLLLVPFAVRHLRYGMYPALDRSLDFQASNSSLMWSDARSAMPAVPRPEPVDAMTKSESAENQNYRQLQSPGSGAGPTAAAAPPSDAPTIDLRPNNRAAKKVSLGEVSLSGSAAVSIGGRTDYQQKLDLSQIDPDAVAQTGPGLPEWSWRSIALRWSGPVEAGAQIHLWLLSPGANLFLAILRVILLALLWLKLLAPSRGGLAKIFARFAKPAGTAAAIAFFAASFSPLQAARASEIPSTEMLDELRARLTKGPACGSECLISPHLWIEAGGAGAQTIRMRMEIDAAAPIAAPLPGALGQWSPESVTLDGKPAAALSRSEDGTLFISLTPGAHQIVLEGALPQRDEIQLALPLKPKRIETRLVGWTLAGLHDDGTSDEALQLVRVLRSGQKNQRLEPGQLPPFLEVQRAILLGLTWQISTRVIRRSPSGAPISIEVPLLPGESITSAGVRAQNGKAQLAFGPHTSELSWTSSLATVPTLALTAADDPSFVEVWRLEIAPTWHVEAKGIPPVHQETAQQRVPEYRPWPGESLVLNISRPAPVPGASLTVQSSKLSVTPGARTTDAQLSLRLSTSRGGPTELLLPEDAELQSLSLDGRSLPVRQDGRKISLSLSPGDHRATLDWREPRGLSILYKTPRPDLQIASVNASLDVNLQNRWVLFAGGPRVGPAILIWSFLLVMLLVAALLSRLGTTPLRMHQWALLALGLSQIDVSAAAIVAGWLLILGWRRNAAPQIPGSRRFDLLQILLVIWTLVAAFAFIGAIERGLLGLPDMQVEGNGSSGSLLRWFTDRAAAQLPGGWVLSFPIFVYRLAMLAWALWLAAAMVRWLPWAWASFSAGGFWRPIPKRERLEIGRRVATPDVNPTPPAATTTRAGAV